MNFVLGSRLSKLASQAGLVLILWGISTMRPAISAPVILTGIVTSEAEGPMEGVLVSAKRVDGTVTITVVSDERGRYSFPAGRLTPGRYKLSIRAVGYVATDSGVEVTLGQGKEADIKLERTADVASQLTDAEWLMSIPDAFEQKRYIYRTCTSCHTMTPILKSTYNPSGWMTAFARMSGWNQVSLITDPVSLPDHESGTLLGNQDFANYLSSINLSSRSTHNFELKTLPRPRGDDTKVIITEYDLPRPDGRPHDALVDLDGTIWYGDFAKGILGHLDPRTGEVKEWQDPLVKPGYPTGFLDLERGPDGSIWLGRHDLNSLAKFDRRTEKFVYFDLPPGTKTSFAVPTRDGKVWTKDTASSKTFRLDPVTGEATSFDSFLPDMLTNSGETGTRLTRDERGPRHQSYGITADSKGNLFEADYGAGNIFRFDGVTGKLSMYPIPTPNSGPRRMHVDSQDRLWFGEYYAKKIGMLDTNTGKFQEWPVPIEWYGPYDVAPGRDGNVWTGTMTSDVILRLNPKTGEYRSYLLPGIGVNVRRVDVDNSGSRPVFWVGENHRAKIAKVEPLE